MHGNFKLKLRRMRFGFFRKKLGKRFFRLTDKVFQSEKQNLTGLQTKFERLRNLVCKSVRQRMAGLRRKDGRRRFSSTTFDNFSQDCCAVILRFISIIFLIKIVVRRKTSESACWIHNLMSSIRTIFFSQFRTFRYVFSRHH